MNAGKQILLLEDDPAIARTVIYALERSGLQVTHCLLVRDALQQLALRPHDLLVLDVGLPDGSGLDVCRQVRAQGATPATIPRHFRKVASACAAFSAVQSIGRP